MPVYEDNTVGMAKITGRKPTLKHSELKRFVPAIKQTFTLLKKMRILNKLISIAILYGSHIRLTLPALKKIEIPLKLLSQSQLFILRKESYGNRKSKKNGWG